MLRRPIFYLHQPIFYRQCLAGRFFCTLVLMYTIGDKIRIIREMKNLSQKYVAAKVGLSQPSYSDIERSKTNLCNEKLNAIAAALNVKPETILNFSEKCIAERYLSVEEHTRIVNEISQLYQDVIKQMEVQIGLLQKQVEKLSSPGSFKI